MVLQDQLASLSVGPGTAIVYDLLGNFSFRYEQDDGGMVLPAAVGGGHHLLGAVGVCTDDMFKTLVGKLVPVLGQLSSIPSVVLSPIPRYVTGGCCTDVSHPHQAGRPGSDIELVEKIVHLRKLLRNELSGSSLTGYWVPDVIDCLSTSGVGTAVSSSTRTEALKKVFSADNVHLNSLGYTKLMGCIVDAIGNAVRKNNDTADCIISGGKQSHYWRGFSSLRGGSRPAHTATAYKSRNAQQGPPSVRGFHPYRAGGRGGRRGRGFRH